MASAGLKEAADSELGVAFRDLLAAEMQWFYRLRAADQRALEPSGDARGPDFPANHHGFAGEVALVLLESTPGAIIALRRSQGGGTGDVHRELTSKYVDEVLRPWLRRTSAATDSFGISLHEVTADRPLTPFSGPLKNAWLLLSEAHPLAADARATFLGPRRTVTFEDIRRVFSHPSAASGPSSRLSRRVMYLSLDTDPYQHPSRRGEYLCCCNVTGYWSEPADARAIGVHFRDTMQAFRSQLGFQIFLNLEWVSDIWGPVPVALCCASAFGSQEGTIQAVSYNGHLKLSEGMHNTTPSGFTTIWGMLSLVDISAFSGRRVRIKGLKGAPELNGAEGEAGDVRPGEPPRIRVSISSPPEAAAAYPDGVMVGAQFAPAPVSFSFPPDKICSKPLMCTLSSGPSCHTRLTEPHGRMCLS